MQIKALDDLGGWGKELVKTAKENGIQAEIVQTSLGLSTGDLFFARIAQKHGKREEDTRIAIEADRAGARLIPSLPLILEYEDKFLQTQRYQGWMPESAAIKSREDALSLLGSFGYPFISKSKTGSASKNVRIVNTEQEAIAEIDAAFGEGIKAPHGLGEGTQRGYLIWQKFFPGNDYDYRACIIGDKIMLLKRYNRDDLPFASGSGRVEQVTKLDDETKQVIEFSRAFFKHFDFQWCGIDLVKEETTGLWKMLETTVGWKQSAYSDRVFFDKRNNDTGKTGKDIWQVFVDYLKGNQ